MTRFRILGTAHVFIGFFLLPLNIAYGIVAAVILSAIPVWIIVLGVLLWRSGAKAITKIRVTHFASAGLAVFLILHGIHSLYLAEKSAEEGGGLLGAYGLVPITYGILLGALSISSLTMVRGRKLKKI